MPRQPEFNRETVVLQAMSVFWERGYGKTSIGDLVNATGLQPGSLYAAFGNKKGLFLEVIEQYNRRFLADIHVLTAEDKPALECIRGLLEQIVEERLTGGNDRGCLTVSALLEMSQHDQDIADRLCEHNKLLLKAFSGLIEKARREGTVATAQSPQALAAFLMNNIWGMRVMCRSKPERSGLEAVVTGVMAALGSR